MKNKSFTLLVKTAMLLLLCVIAQISFAQQQPVGIFENHLDVGHPKNAGSATYDAVTHTYTIKGSGYNIWFNRDEFQYLYKTLKGDFTVTANFEFLGATGNNHRKVGWMIREGTGDKAIHVSAVEHGDGLTVLQWRSVTGENMKDPEGEIFYPDKTFEVLQLQRIGKRLIMRVGHVGEPLKTVGAHTMNNMPEEALVGLFICSHDSEIVEQARVWNVRIIQGNEELK